MLLRVYDYCLAIMPDYITKEGEVQHASLKVFVNEMKLHEKDIISEIIFKEEQGKAKEERMKEEKKNAERIKNSMGNMIVPE
jgi:5'-3' exonuclease